MGSVQYLLQAVDIRRKRRDDDAPLDMWEELVKRFTDRRFAHGKSRTRRVRGIAHHEQHTLGADLRNALEIRRRSIHRRLVKFEIPRVEDDAQRRVDRHSARIWNAVAGLDQFHLHVADLERFAVLHNHQSLFAEIARLLELRFEQPDREARAVNRHVELSQDVRQATDVVFVAVGENNALHLLLVRREIGDIRDHTVDAEQVFRREAHPCIDDDDLILIFDGRHILPDLFQSAQRDDLDAIGCFFLRNDDFLLL